MQGIFLSPVLLICYFFFLSEAEPLWGGFGAAISPLKPNKIPFVVLITNKNSADDYGTHLCTGSLITDKFVLTGASCLKNLPETSLQVHVRSGSPESKILKAYDVSLKVTYEQWCKTRQGCTFVVYTDDISILKLSDSIGFIEPGSIAFKKLDLKNVRLIGWGHIADHNRPKSPRKALMTVLTKPQCQQRVKSLITDIFNQVDLPQKFFCAVSSPPVLGVQGDYGGPLIDKYDRIFGIFVRRCPALFCRDILPGQVNLVLRLSEFEGFISDVLIRYR